MREPHPDPSNDPGWRAILSGDEQVSTPLRRLRRIFRPMPSDPRCKLCYAPYGAPFGPIVARLGYGKWDRNPSLCGACMRQLMRHRGGAEIELSLLFADLRGSTQLSEAMSPAAYSTLLNEFYAIAARAIQQPGGTVDKYLGDGVFALFIPGFAGKDHAAKAVGAARRILRDSADSPRLPAEVRPLPVGIGVHTGEAYVGVLGEADGPLDFSALGEAVNVTQRLSSSAAARELVISATAAASARLDTEGLEARSLELKGISHAVDVWVEAPDRGLVGGEGLEPPTFSV